MYQKKILTKFEAISLACTTAKYCGIPQKDIEMLNAVLVVQIDRFIEKSQLAAPKENAKTT